MDKNFKFGLPDSVIDAVRQVMEAKKMKGVCPHCGKNPCECDHDHDEMDEELKGGQKKLDKNHNGKIDAEDFKILRKKKGMKEEADQIDELSKGTMKSYVKQVDKKGESDKRHEGLAMASKKIAKQETNRTLQRAVNKIGNTPGSKKKASDAHKYDASRQELKGRGIHNFAGRRTRYEEADQIDELSKGTLKSYVNRASDELVTHAKSWGHAQAVHKPGANYNKVLKPQGKMLSRMKGINDAAKKLAKEDVEQIDELSKKTMTSYIDKATHNLAAHGHAMGHDLATQGVRSKDRLSKTLNRQKGIQAAASKLAKEEVENIDELSKDTLKSYIKKSTSGSAPNSALNLAAHAAHKMTRRKGSDVDVAIKLRDKAEKRGEGIVKAASKLAKEDVEFSAEELARIEEIAANLDEVVTLRKMTPAEKKAHAEYLSKHSEKLAQAEKTAVKGDSKTFKQRNTEPGDYSKEPSKMGLRQSLADKGKVS